MKPTKKKQLRNMRKGQSTTDSKGRTVTHKMGVASGTVTNKRGKTKTVHTVYPTATPKKKGSTSTKRSDWTTQTAREAYKKGETVDFKSKKRAERVAAGSWKKGPAKKAAMKEYRATKRTTKKKK